MVLLGLAGCDLLEQKYPEDVQYTFTPHPIDWDKDKQEKKFLPIEPPWTAAKITRELKPFFGTPRKPIVKASTEVISDPHMQLQSERLAKGSELYRRYCLHCHGLVGDGNGPTGEFLNPKPRDYRRGAFKFRSTSPLFRAKQNTPDDFEGRDQTSPARSDLLRTLRNGIPGSAMPSFNMLPDDDLQALVSYVIHLSLRGQVEERLASAGGEVEVEPLVQRTAELWLRDTRLTSEPPPAPPQEWSAYQRALDEGKKLYLSDSKGACAKCHGVDGRVSLASVGPSELQRRNVWGDVSPPRDLSLGVFRGGSRPVDIYYRIKLGIQPSGMPASPLSDDEIWHLVAYALSLAQQP